MISLISPTWCYVTRSCLALAHRLDATSPTGGYVSQASLQNRAGLPITCSCGQVSTLEHEIWECQYVPEILNRPRTPSNPILMRLGWPVCTTDDEAILAWMIACPKRSLALRYKPPSNLLTLISISQFVSSCRILFSFYWQLTVLQFLTCLIL
jgi:hypothetical protein